MSIFWRFSKFIRLVWESFRFAWQAMRSNILRTTLSLLGVSIGIFAIVAVFTIVDSLERKIRDDMSFIGDDVMYIQKFPWGFGNSTYPWWKYFQRPISTITEFKFLDKNIKNAKAVVFMAQRGNNTLKFKNISFSPVFTQGVSYGYAQISELEIQSGRYFSIQEAESSRNVALIGHDIAEAFFLDKMDPIGQTIKSRGLSFTVIGVMKKEGMNLFGFSSRDNLFLIPYGAFAKLFRIGNRGVEPFIALKGREDDANLVALEGEVTGLLRSKRGIKPTQEDNFALNRTESFAEAITSLFSVITVAGWVIGSFSILVGGFGIANIMFVSVKERTNIIGIQKSLGAKNYFILFQFLFEAVFLSLIGGLVGIFLVYLITFIPFPGFTILMSLENIMLGLTVASVVGVLSGVAPAYMAASLDPVEAIRAK